jgi:hypothetical protein
MGALGQIILNRFKGGAKPVPQFLKPGAGWGHEGVARRAGGAFFHEIASFVTPGRIYTLQTVLL